MTEIKLEIREEQRELYERLLGIVHCKECSHQGTIDCPMDEQYADDYCSYGERKENEAEKICDIVDKASERREPEQ